MAYTNKDYWQGLVGQQMLLKEVGWPEWTEAYNKARYDFTAKGTDKALNEFIITPPKKILEIGCGIGFWTNLLTKKYPDAEYLGLDISPKAIETLSSRYTDSSIIRFMQTDVSVPFDQLSKEINETKYDLIVCFEVLLHIVKDDSWANAVNNICRLKAENGHIFLSEPMFKLIKPYPYAEHMVNKLRRWDDYMAILNKHHLRVLDVRARTFLLDNNFDFRFRIVQKAWNYFFSHYYKWLCKPDEKLGARLGRIATAIDSVYTRINKTGHSCRLLIIQ